VPELHDLRLVPVVFNLFVLPIVQHVLVVPKLLSRLLDLFLVRRACHCNAGRLRTTRVFGLRVVCGRPSGAGTCACSADLCKPGAQYVQPQRIATDFSAGEYLAAATDIPRIAEAGTGRRFVVGPDSATAAAEGARRCRLDGS
jgi:hypothetical protein